MKITVIYGTGRKGISSTYNLAQKVIDRLKENDEVHEFFLPKDMDHFCIGCYSCVSGNPEKCSGYEKVNPIREAINKSELIIFTTPVYVYHVPGQVKALLDHFAYQWMVHQFNGSMVNKQSLIISTAAGAGIKSTIKDMKDNMLYWGVGKVYSYKKVIWKGHWSELDEKTKSNMEEDILKLAEKIYKRKNNVKPRLKVKLLFYGCRFMQKRIGLNSVDVEYWKKQGWLEHGKPW